MPAQMRAERLSVMGLVVKSLMQSVRQSGVQSVVKLVVESV
jgi:hypothetical protein